MLGLFTGICVPLVSNVYPIKQALNATLRDALDRSRKSVDDTEVQILRMENAGCSPVQVAFGLTVASISFLTLYVIPRHIMELSENHAFFGINLLLIAVIIGVIFMSQALSPGLSRTFLDLIFTIKPRDKLMAPLIRKNLESHAQKNMKANLMYTVTICFLVYSATSFLSSAKYLRQMADIVFGADITLRSLRPSAKIALDEFKLREIIDPMLAENGGKVESYTLLSSTMVGQMRAAGRQPVSEYLLGSGLIQNKSMLKNLQLQAIEESTLNTMNKGLVWYPADILSQPLGEGTQ